MGTPTLAAHNIDNSQPHPLNQTKLCFNEFLFVASAVATKHCVTMEADHAREWKLDATSMTPRAFLALTVIRLQLEFRSKKVVKKV